MGKYTPFTDWLKKQSHNMDCHLLFTSWDNRHGGIQNCWLDAGWKTVMVDLENEKVKFQRK